jgi:hypothetical protein
VTGLALIAVRASPDASRAPAGAARSRQAGRLVSFRLHGQARGEVVSGAVSQVGVSFTKNNEPFTFALN